MLWSCFFCFASLRSFVYCLCRFWFGLVFATGDSGDGEDSAFEGIRRKRCLLYLVLLVFFKFSALLSQCFNCFGAFKGHLGVCEFVVHRLFDWLVFPALEVFGCITLVIFDRIKSDVQLLEVLQNHNSSQAM